MPWWLFSNPIYYLFFFRDFLQGIHTGLFMCFWLVPLTVWDKRKTVCRFFMGMFCLCGFACLLTPLSWHMFDCNAKFVLLSFFFPRFLLFASSMATVKREKHFPGNAQMQNIYTFFGHTWVLIKLYSVFPNTFQLNCDQLPAIRRVRVFKLIFVFWSFSKGLAPSRNVVKGAREE